MAKRKNECMILFKCGYFSCIHNKDRATCRHIFEDKCECKKAQIEALKAKLEELTGQSDITLKDQLDFLTQRRFPIQGGASIPWSMIAPHERQHKINHGNQTLERMSQRGGLSPFEALAVLDDKRMDFKNIDNTEKTHNELERRRLEYESKMRI